MSAFFVLEVGLILSVGLLCSICGGALGMIALNLIMRDRESVLQRGLAAAVGGILCLAAAALLLVFRL